MSLLMVASQEHCSQELPECGCHVGVGAAAPREKEPMVLVRTRLLTPYAPGEQFVVRVRAGARAP